MLSPRGSAAARWADGLAGGSLALVVLLLLLLVGRPLATDDLWWHLKLGEVYAEQGPWVSEDPLYHTTTDRPTVPHEWLFQVAVHWLERGLGFQGLRAAHVLAVAGLALWVLRIFRRAGGSMAPACLAALVFLELSWFRLFQFRPDLVSIAALFALYELLLARQSPPGWPRTLAACAVFLVWVNVHSLFAIGLALILAALLGVGLQRGLMWAVAGAKEGSSEDSALAVGLGLALLGAGLVTLANPQGFSAHTLFLVESASGDIWQLQDDFLPWNPFSPALDNRALTPLCWGLANVLLAACLWTAAVAGARVFRERSPVAIRDFDCVHLGLSAAAFVAMLTSVRFHWLAFLPLIYLLRAWQRSEQASPRPQRVFAAMALASAALACAFPAGIQLESYVREVAAERDGYQSAYLDQRYCGAGTRFLDDAGIKGNLFHPFNLGGFLGFWLSPELRTFIDGRMDHYPSDVLRDYLRIRHASQGGALPLLRKLLDEREVDVFFGTSFPESRYSDRFWTGHVRRMSGWLPIWASHTHSIYLRRNSRNARNLRLAKAWYMQRRIPFSYEKGVDMGTAIDRRPAWVAKQGIVPAEYAELLDESRSSDAQKRRIALAELGRIYWQIGAFEKQVEADAAVAALDPAAKEARRRLADGLLQLGRAVESLEVATALHAEDPDYEDIRLILAYAQDQVRNQAPAPPRPRP